MNLLVLCDILKDLSRFGLVKDQIKAGTLMNQLKYQLNEEELAVTFTRLCSSLIPLSKGPD